MGQFSTNDFVGTRTRFQRFSDSKLMNGWISAFTLSNLTVRATTEHYLQKGDRFIFHVNSPHTNARFVADFLGVDGIELFRTMNLQFDGDNQANLIEVPEASFQFRVVSQLEYQPPTEEVRQAVGGWVVEVSRHDNTTEKAFLSDVSETGAGVLSPVAYQRGEIVRLKLDAQMRSLELSAEIRYSVRSKIAPDMFKSGLKLCEFGRLEGAVWRNFLKAA